MHRIVPFAVLLVTAAGLGWLGRTTRVVEAGPAPLGDVQTFLADNCVSCHSGEAPDAGFDLARLDLTAQDVETLTHLRHMADRVRAGEMPPPEMPAPERATAVRMADGMDAHVLRTLEQIELDPGRVTVRRLSRVEYRNTIRDLLGVAFEPSSSFPNDDLAYGFDNIGDVLSVSPLLLEKYAAAAQRIAEQAILLEDPDNPPVRRLEAESMDSSRGDDRGRGANTWNLFSSGDITARVTLPRDGEYRLRARVMADQAGPEQAKVTFLAGGRGVHIAETTKGDREPEVLEHTLRLPKGQLRVGVGFPNDYYEPNDPDPSQRDRNLIVDWVELVGPIDRLEPPMGHTWLMGADPGKGKPFRRAMAVSSELLRRAWRRKPKTDEVRRIAGLIVAQVEAGEPFARGVQMALRAALVSPHFLYRLEPGATSGKKGTARPVDDEDLAVRLSYFLWSSMPDDALFERARKRKLRKPDALKAEVERMLADPKASSLSTNFAVQWLELRNLEYAEPDPKRFPGFSPALAEAMRREAELFFETILKEERDATELLRADFTFLNGPLARHYGVSGVDGDAFQRVTLTDARRGGILTQAGVLTVTSNPTRTSPVKRGKWVLENILDAAPPPPPPGADSLDEEVVTKSPASLREKLEIHRADPVCASCHTRMDALGLALEAFDPVGAWRQGEGAASIDTSATLPDGRQVDGPTALKQVLAEDRAFLRCLTKKLFTFAIGRDPGPADELAIFRLVEGLPEGKATIKAIVTQIVLLDAFRMRRVRE
ncbi:MAG: DUF1592 domain-containing protein [Planctomycetota bacterium]|nr:DUF1592 domain-containing protein [Planctomycetota bacterium]